jgi:hypothetical protein
MKAKDRKIFLREILLNYEGNPAKKLAKGIFKYQKKAPANRGFSK